MRIPPRHPYRHHASHEPRTNHHPKRPQGITRPPARRAGTGRTPDARRAGARRKRTARAFRAAGRRSSGPLGCRASTVRGSRRSRKWRSSSGAGTSRIASPEPHPRIQRARHRASNLVYLPARSAVDRLTRAPVTGTFARSEIRRPSSSCACFHMDRRTPAMCPVSLSASHATTLLSLRVQVYGITSIFGARRSAVL